MAKMVRVLPLSDEIAKNIQHPTFPRAFTDLNTPQTWPLDAFTQRRIDEGVVKVVEDEKQPQAKQPAQAARTGPTVAQPAPGGPTGASGTVLGASATQPTTQPVPGVRGAPPPPAPGVAGASGPK